MNRPGNSLILTISRRRIREWGLKDGARVPVYCGGLQGHAVVQELDTDEERTSLQWSHGRLDWERGGLTGRFFKTDDGQFRIGPVIGIMTIGVRDDSRHPVGARTSLLGDFVRAAREANVLCYIFNASDADWQQGVVRGVTLIGKRGEERWKSYRFPLPDVVYNRVPHRTAEVRSDVLLCKKRCAELEIPLFNERFVNKREMYGWLLQDEKTRELIPATERLRSSEALARFCRSHSLVFLKPTGGSLGSGIIKVRRGPDSYEVRYRRQKEHVSTAFHRTAALYQFVKTLGTGRIYLMQQGIRLMKYEGNPTDFRVHMHKNGYGEWVAAGIGAKVAGRGAVTTHVHNGGRVVAGDVVLSQWYGTDATKMRTRMIEAAVRVCESLEGLLNGPVGEWGLDVAIDEDGRVYVFEANAKPGRAIFRHPNLRSAGRVSANLVVEYAASLAGYPLWRGGSG